MFSRNHRSRVTVARGSALEMEFRRGRFRLSVFCDPPEVRGPGQRGSGPVVDFAGKGARTPGELGHYSRLAGLCARTRVSSAG